MRHLAVLLLLLLPATALGQGYFDGYTEGYGGAVVAPVDTVRILSGSALYPNTAAAAEYGYEDGDFDTVNRSDDGSALRYGTMYQTIPDAVYTSNTAAIITRGHSTEDDSGPQSYTAMFWHSTNGLPTDVDLKILDAYVVFNHYSKNDVAAGQYVSIRGDTLSSDYAILHSDSPTSDPNLFNMTYNHVDKPESVAWDPPWDDRDDWHDIGPRSGDKHLGTYTDIDEGSVQKFDVTDIVQQIENNGELERGILVAIANVGTGNHQYAAGRSSLVGSVGLGAPELVIIATIEPSPDPWDGKRMPIGLTLDDGYPIWGEWFPTMLAEGIPFNPFYTGNLYEANASLDSLYSVNGDDINFGAHSYTGDLLGELNSAELDAFLAKGSWIISGNFAGAFPDTSYLEMNLAWPGGEGTKHSILALKKLKVFGYRSGRGTNKRAWDATPIGAITYPSWLGYTNLYAYVAPNAGLIFEDLSEPSGVATKETMKEAMDDLIDVHYTDGLQAALMLYAHKYDDGGFGEHITTQGLIWYDEIIDDADYLHHMGPAEMISLLRGNGLLEASDVELQAGALAAAGGATDSLYYYDLEMTAARLDSAQIADVHTEFDAIFTGPAEE